MQLMQTPFENVAVFNFYVYRQEKKVIHTTSMYNILMSNQMGDILSLHTLSVLTFVINLFSAFYINPQLSLGPKYFNINQK